MNDRIRMVNVADTGWMELTPRLAADLKESKTARYGWLVEDEVDQRTYLEKLCDEYEHPVNAAARVSGWGKPDPRVLERTLKGRALCLERLAPCLEAECPNHGACIDVTVEEKDITPEAAADIAAKIEEKK